MNDTASETIVCTACGALNKAPAAKLAAGARPKCGKCGAPLFSGEPVAARSVADFERQTSKGTLPVLVDFWAEWCGPCKAMAPQFSAAAAMLEPGVRLMKLDTEALPEVAGRFGIRSIPTLILIRGGREIARQSGVMDAQSIKRWTEAAMQRG